MRVTYMRINSRLDEHLLADLQDMPSFLDNMVIPSRMTELCFTTFPSLTKYKMKKKSASHFNWCYFAQLSHAKMRTQYPWNAFCVLSTILGLNGLVSSASAIFQNDPAPLMFEHPGDIFKSVSATTCCVSGVLTDGNSTGAYRNISGGRFPLHMQ